MLFIATSISVLVFLINSYILRKIPYDGVNSDAKKHAFASSKYKDWGFWPSGMHKFSSNKAWMKDVGILLTVIFQKILQDTKSFYPALMVANLSHCLSAILIFLLTDKFLNEEVSLIILVLYIFSPWSYMIIFHGGLQVLAQFFFLLSIFMLPFFQGYHSDSFINYFLSGFFIALMNFSSASSRKLNPLYFFFLFLSIYFGEESQHFFELNLTTYEIYFLSFSILFLLFMFLIKISNKFITKLLYQDRLWFKFSGKNVQGIAYYEHKVKHLTKYVLNVTCVFFFIFFSVLLLLDQELSYLYLLTCIAGLIAGCSIFLLPNLSKNLVGFYNYSIIETDYGSHYRLYDNYFLKKYGVVYEKGKEGIFWYVLFYLRMIPFESFLFLISPFLFVLTVYYQFDISISLFIFLLMPLFGILYGELTTGPKAALPLYTTYIGFFLPIFVILNLSSEFVVINYLEFLGFTLLLAFRNIYIIFNDIFPSRSSVTKLDELLSERGVTEFSTVSTEYNYPFIDVLLDQFRDKYKVNFINSLDELHDGYLFIPCLSSLAPYYQSTNVATIPDIDRDELDKIILESVQNNKAEKIPTLGGSKYWRTIGNVCAFRDISLKEREILHRQYAWLIKA